MFDQTINDEATVSGEEGALLAGRYSVVKQLGQGGMGSVWLVKDTKLDNKLFAVKMLPSILVTNKRAYAQVKREALVAMKLVHPNIVQVRAFEEDSAQGNPFIVMDYIEGETLDDLLGEKGTLTEEETVRILKPVAAALDYAHGEGIVHRDVKPGNIIIRKDGRPFILDFGIAREMQETMTRVTGKLSSGTLMYMSPEQLNGAAPKPAQDVYSFAAMAYECLKGEPPFSRGQIEHQIETKIPDPLPGGPRSCAAAIMSGMEKDPQKRPGSCSAVLAAGWTRSGSVGTPVVTRFNWKWIGAAAIVLAALVAGIFGYMSYRENKNTALAIAAFTADPPRWSEGFTLAQKADRDDAEIQFYIGKCYFQGNGVAKDEAEAVKWYRKAAEQGHVKAQNNLGMCYALGEGVAQDYGEAVKWFRKAAEQGYAGAQNNLGLCCEKGQGVAQDKTEAVKWYRKAAEQGVAQAQCGLGTCYAKGKGVAQDYGEAVRWYRKAAEQGDAVAQCNLGWCYAKGEGVAQDYVEAAKWYRKAAEQGYAAAQYNLGLCYDNGNGVAQDYVEAVKWYRKAADQGNAQAQCNLGLRYAKGEGVVQDYAEAARWFRKAAEQGDAVAQCSLGGCYYEGNGVAQDYAEAVRWYRKAADQGFAQAQYDLGVCYYNGDGVEQDYVEAVKWWRKAAEQGDAAAQFFLGVCYALGRGVAEDKTEAVKWYRKAAEQGHENAKEALRDLGY